MAPAPPLTSAQLEAARAAVREAGALAAQSFRPGQATVADIQYKSGGSPVTAADLAVDAFLQERLRALAPGFGWLSEETADDRSRLASDQAWVVDPIDGTRAFARGDPDWTVAVGVVSAGVPVAGFVYAPVIGDFYEAAPGLGARLNGRALAVTAPAADSTPRVAGPVPMLESLARAGATIERMPKIHSLAYRLVTVASGGLDAALASGRAHDWDLAAAHAILKAAGAVLRDEVGEVPRYNRSSTVHAPLVAAAPALAEHFVAWMSDSAVARGAGSRH